MAAVFRFRLQRILELREHELQTRRLELATAQRAETEARVALARARDERRERDVALRDVEGAAISTLELRARRAATEAHAAREERLVKSAHAAGRAVERARQAAVEAQRQVRVMESLRDKARQRWLAGIDAQDRRIQDDIQSRYGEDPLD